MSRPVTEFKKIIYRSNLKKAHDFYLRSLAENFKDSNLSASSEVRELLQTLEEIQILKNKKFAKELAKINNPSANSGLEEVNKKLDEKLEIINSARLSPEKFTTKIADEISEEDQKKFLELIDELKKTDEAILFLPKENELEYHQLRAQITKQNHLDLEKLEYKNQQEIEEIKKGYSAKIENVEQEAKESQNRLKDYKELSQNLEKLKNDDVRQILIQQSQEINKVVAEQKSEIRKILVQQDQNLKEKLLQYFRYDPTIERGFHEKQQKRFAEIEEQSLKRKTSQESVATEIATDDEKDYQEPKAAKTDTAKPAMKFHLSNYKTVNEIKSKLLEPRENKLRT